MVLDVGLAEEIAAEAFMHLWRRWPEIHDDDHAGGFVYTTAMRLCFRRKKRADREVLGEVDDVPHLEEAGSSLERREIFAALAELPLRQRQSVVLRDWAGFETEEIAEMLEMQAGTVRVHLARGRDALRRRLGTKEQDS